LKRILLGVDDNLARVKPIGFLHINVFANDALVVHHLCCSVEPAAGELVCHCLTILVQVLVTKSISCSGTALSGIRAVVCALASGSVENHSSKSRSAARRVLNGPTAYLWCDGRPAHLSQPQTHAHPRRVVSLAKSAR